MEFVQLEEKIKNKYNNSFDLKFRKFTTKNDYILITYLETLCDSNLINEYILKRISINIKNIKDIKNTITGTNMIVIEEENEIYNYLNNGFTILFFNDEIIAIETRRNLTRGVNEPTIEQTISGPKDSLNEDYVTNIGLIRRRIKNDTFTIIEEKIGKKSKTKVGILYLKGTAEDELVEEITKKIKNIDLDYIMDSTFISQSIVSSNNVFPLAETTERPDLICMSLFQGKVCIVVENSPSAIIIPTFFVDLFHTPEDYYQSPKNVTFTRIIRLIAFFVAVILPAFYIAITTFNHETIPLSLIINFASQRNGVPFPTFIEALGMILVFEILRESDLRMPSVSGNAISILGAIVLGDAAVSAGIVSPIMVIIIALSSICSLMFNHVSMVNAIRLWKIIFLIFAVSLGLVGVVFALFLFIVITCSIKSFGKPYFYPIAPFEKNEIKDSFTIQNINKQKQDPVLVQKEVLK